MKNVLNLKQELILLTGACIAFWDVFIAFCAIGNLGKEKDAILSSLVRTIISANDEERGPHHELML